MKKTIIFVGGTGRSGTHLIGRSLSSHPELHGRIESSDTFELITKIASTQDYCKNVNNLLRKVILIHRLKNHLKNSEYSIVEKSHPSIWLASDLLNKIKYSKMILVYRDILPTVSSMLSHKGVLKWYDALPQDKLNRFLGIDAENKKIFKDFSLEEKCAHRWRSHIIQISNLYQRYPGRILPVNYEKFLNNQEQWFENIAAFLDLDNSFNSEPLNLASLHKWKSQLSTDQILFLRRLKFFSLINDLEL